MDYIQAKNYTAIASRAIDLLVTHDMEMAEKPNTAEGCANFFHNQAKGPSGSSAHYCLDNNSAVQCVVDHDVAWHAPGANHDGLGFEHAGYARQTEADWLDAFSKQMLFKVSAPLYARKCKTYSIPPVFLHAPALVAQRRGITTHWEVTRAFSHGQGHTDPGTGFPMDRFIFEIQKLMGVKAADAPNHGKVVKAPQPTIKSGATGFRVKQLQRLLNNDTAQKWDDIKVDGSFGPGTESKVKQFQKNAGLKADGVVGPNTWAALWAARYNG